MHLLLDTCVVQNLHWARTRAPDVGDEIEMRRLEERFGPAFAQELRAVAGLLEGVERILDVEGELCPFIVSRASWQELCRARGTRGEELRGEWRLWRARAQDFDAEAFEIVPHPRFTAMPEVLGWPGPGQSCLPRLRDGWDTAEVFGPFRDAGDRLLIQDAMRLEVPAILTTDLRTFWRHRGWLYAHGLEVWRPSDFCWQCLNNSYRGDGILPVWATRTEPKVGAAV